LTSAAGPALECYVEAGCVVAGVDTSEAMLGRAHVRLGDRADLRHGDAGGHICRSRTLAWAWSRPR